jgi:hypothetical protein
MSQFGIVTFENTYQALKFEKVMKQTQIKVDMIPVPRRFSSSCGIAGKFEYELKEDIERICSQNDVVVHEIFIYQQQNKGLLNKIFNGE